MERTIGIGNALVDILVQLKDDTLLGKIGLPRGGMTLIDEVQQENLRTHMKGLPMEEAHKLAVEVSAYVCTQNGAMPTLPKELLNRI